MSEAIPLWQSEDVSGHTVRYEADEEAEKDDGAAYLVLYPSDKRERIGDVEDAKIFMVWAMTRDESALSSFGEKGYTDDRDFVKQLEKGLESIAADKGLFETILAFGDKILDVWGDADGAALIED